MPLGTYQAHPTEDSLIPSVVAPDFLEFAIAIALVRPHLDKSHELYSHGEEH